MVIAGRGVEAFRQFVLHELELLAPLRSRQLTKRLLCVLVLMVCCYIVS